MNHAHQKRQTQTHQVRIVDFNESRAYRKREANPAGRRKFSRSLPSGFPSFMLIGGNNMSIAYIWQILQPMLDGAQMTILLFIVAIVLSIPFGFLLNLAVQSPIKVVSRVAQLYIALMRGTPLLLQLLVICFGLPMIPGIGTYLVFDRFVAACIGFVLNYTAYFAEIFRGGMLAIDRGQYEAAQVLGISRLHTLTRVVIPQMTRVALPSIANESVTLIKDTSLLYAVAVPELLHYAQTAVNRDFTIFPFVLAGILYLLMTALLTLFFKFLERRFRYE
jgi:polar amino acid transport system permease protein